MTRRAGFLPQLLQPAGRTPGGRVIAQAAAIDTRSWTLELGELRREEGLFRDLGELATATGGTNIFFEPEMLAAAMDRIGDCEKQLLALWEEDGGRRHARTALILTPAHGGLPPVRMMRVWSHPFGPLSLPLVSREATGQSCARFAELLVQSDLLGDDVLVFRDFPVEEPAGMELVSAFRAAGLRLAWTGEYERACLRPLPPDPRQPAIGRTAARLPTKRRKELARQLRRLGETGVLEFERASEFHEVMLRFEEFLLLEARSWKGREGTSFHDIRRTASFARQSVAALSDRGRCSLYSLRLDGKAVASLIVLRSGGHWYPWKIAFDEAYGAYSPGVQLILRVSDEMLADPDFEFADSLAAETAWITRHWPDRMRLATLAVAGGKRAAQRARSAAAAIAREESLRRIYKRFIRRDPVPLRLPRVHDRETDGE
jgi:hypothetical protein